MMKKIATVAGAAALLFGSATPALAWGFRMPSYDVTNKAYIDNNVTVKADTGDNTQRVYGTGSNEMGTGDATAYATVYTMANIFGDCGCMPHGDVYNKADVDNNIYVKADTGDNYQKVWGGIQMPSRHHHGATSGNVMWTGAALAGADVWTVVNVSGLEPAGPAE